MKRCTPFILLSFCLAFSLLQRAGATIIYNDVPDIVTTTTGTSTDPAFQVDINGDMINDFGIEFSSPSPHEGYVRRLTVGNSSLGSYQSNYWAVVNVIGTVIGPSTTWLNDNSNSDLVGNLYGNNNGWFGWYGGVDGYFAVRLGTSGNYYYGWVRVHLTSTSFTLKDFAFENTLNEPIDAGEMPPPLNYTFSGTGNWDDATKWTPSYPGTNVTTGDAVIIDGTCTMNTSVTCTIPMTINASASLTVASPNTFNVNGNLTNEGGFSVSSNASVNIQVGTGSFVHNGTSLSLSGQITNNGSFTVNAGKTMAINSGGHYREKGSGTINGTLTNNGDFTVFATFSLTIASGGSFTHAGDLASISGMLLNNGDLAVNVINILSIQSSGTFTHNGTSAIINGTLTNAGTVNVNAGKTLTINNTFTHNGTSASISGTLTNNSSITVNASKTLTINSSGNYIGNGGCVVYGNFLNEGAFTLNATKTMAIQSGGTFTQNGTNSSVDGYFSVSGTFTINAGKTMTFSSTATYVAFGTLTISGTLLFNGDFSANGGSVTISSGGTFTLNGTIASHLTTCTIVNNGDLTVGAGKLLSVNSNSSLTHNGASAVISGSLATPFPTSAVTINAGKTLTIASGGSFTHTGNSVTVTGTLAINSGGSFTQDSNSPVSISGALTNSGTVTVNSGRTLNNNPGSTFTNNGTVTNNGTFNNSGTFSGTGTFNGSLNNTGGTVSPGASPGCMTLGSSFTNNGTVSIEVNGTTACSGHDKITMSGTANLGGTLSVSINYTPTLGDVITFLDAGTVSGTFFNNNPALPTGWVVQYNSPSSGDVSLKYTQPPANDNCSGAVSTTLSATGACSYVNGTTVDATLSFAFACAFGGNEAYLDVWYSFTAPSSGKVTFHSGTGSPFAVVHSSCSGAPLAGGCMRGNGTVAGLTSGATYYLQLLTPGSSGMAFSFCLEDSDTPPNNNSCNSALSIELGNPLLVNSLYAVTNTLPPCAPLPSLNAPDLWYSFTAPSSGEIGYAYSGATVLMTVYSGTCSGLMQVVCAVPLGGNAPNNLIPGNTYYAQLSSIGASANASSTISAPNVYSFTGATSNAWNLAANWQSGVVPTSGNNITIPTNETCELNTNFTSTGSLTIESNAVLRIQEGFTLTKNSGVTTNNGTIAGGGTFTGDFTNFSGIIAPGESPGCLTFNGSLSNNGTIQIEVNGTTACTQYDRINVAGTATLGGALEVSIGYSPSNGHVITFIDASAISGTFSTINPALPTGWNVMYNFPNAGEVSLQYLSLPIELVDFSAKMLENKVVLLNWQTASEANNEGFYIENAADGKDWQTLAFVPGHGTSSIARFYDYTDRNPLKGTNYYRLKQVDYNGDFEYSPTVSVELAKDFGISISPNPVAAGSATLNFETTYTGEALLTLFDLTGKQVYTKQWQLEGNTTSTVLDLRGLAGGNYWAIISAGAQRLHCRMVVQ